MSDKTKDIIFSLVSRGNDTVLSEYSPHIGNFKQRSLELLKRLNLKK
jgi:hypothetical protein